MMVAVKIGDLNPSRRNPTVFGCWRLETSIAVSEQNRNGIAPAGVVGGNDILIAVAVKIANGNCEWVGPPPAIG